MPQPNLSHLNVFAAVGRHKSFQRAAAEAGMSTSAVSHAIRGLEERLGVSLLNRTTRSVSLTDAGQRLLERLQPALRDVGDALEEMNSFRARPTGTLRINTSRAGAQLVILPLIQKFLAAYPEIRLEIVDEDGLVDIVAGGFDAGIRFIETVLEDMVAVNIGSICRLVVVAAPSYFANRPIPLVPDDLRMHDCIRYRFPSGRMFKWEFEKGDTKLELDVDGRVTVGELALAVRAARDGVGLAFVFEEYALDDLAQGRLVRVLEDWCPRFPGFMLYYPRQRQMPSALRAFIDLAQAQSNTAG